MALHEPTLGFDRKQVVQSAVGFGMQSEAQSALFGSAKQAICKDTMRPNPARQLCQLFTDAPLDAIRPDMSQFEVIQVSSLQLESFPWFGPVPLHFACRTAIECAFSA